jgi:hypothetical protein
LKITTCLAIAGCNVTIVSFEPISYFTYAVYAIFFIAGNILALADIARSFTFQAIMNATVSVDTFFVLRFVLFKEILFLVILVKFFPCVNQSMSCIHVCTVVLWSVESYFL